MSFPPTEGDEPRIAFDGLAAVVAVCGAEHREALADPDHVTERARQLRNFVLAGTGPPQDYYALAVLAPSDLDVNCVR